MLFAPSKCLGFLLHACVGAIQWLHIPSWGAAGVARWTKNVNVFSQDLLIIPINHDSLHWCLATVDMRSRAISYFDSMRGSGLSGMPSALPCFQHKPRFCLLSLTGRFTLPEPESI